MDAFRAAIALKFSQTGPFFICFVGMIFLDVAFGLSAAISKNALDSSVGRLGMMRKILMVFTVLVAGLFDGIFPLVHFSILGFDATITIAGMVSIWWMIVEALSISEKAGVLGIPLPARFKDSLVKVKKAFESDEPSGK